MFRDKFEQYMKKSVIIENNFNNIDCLNKYKINTLRAIYYNKYYLAFSVVFSILSLIIITISIFIINQPLYNIDRSIDLFNKEIKNISYDSNEFEIMFDDLDNLETLY